MKRDQGETLIELLMTTMIVGIGSVAMLSALGTVVVSNESHRRLGDTEVTTRQFTEAIEQKWLDAATTTLTAAVPEHQVYGPGGDTVTLSVASADGFPDAEHTVAISGEIFRVTSGFGTTTWTAEPLASGSIGAGATVQLYISCPSADDLRPVVSSPALKLAAPDLDATVEYFTASGSPVSSCADYWQSSATTCGNTAALEHLTACDPALIRASFSVRSTDAGATGATTTTQVLLRRGA